MKSGSTYKPEPKEKEIPVQQCKFAKKETKPSIM